MLTFISMLFFLALLPCDGDSIWPIISGCGIGVFGFLAIICGIFSHIETSETSETVIKEYSSKEWKLDYKIISIGDKSDTTFVLTKIK